MDNLTPRRAWPIARGFLPVVVDVETGGFECNRHALLEIAASADRARFQGRFVLGPTVSTHVRPFPARYCTPRSMEVTGIDVTHPFRDAKPEREALDLIFHHVRMAARKAECQRAILVGHNAPFDLGFINAAVARVALAHPFHPFSTFDALTWRAWPTGGPC
jgi:ribonuclease T